MDEKQPCFVTGISKPPKRLSWEKTFSALQLEKGLGKGEPTYVAAMIKIKPDKQVEVLDAYIIFKCSKSAILNPILYRF